MNFEKELSELKAKVTPVNTVKFLVGTLISCGAMAAVVMALKGQIKGAKGITKLMMNLGILVLGCKTGEIAEDYFNQKVDEFLSSIKEVQEEEKNESNAN